MSKRKQASRATLERSWGELLSTAATPLLLVDAQRRIAFANESLAQWMGLPLREIVGRLVEYHSEPTEEDATDRGGVISGLCPPPAALAGHRTRGTIASLGRDGRLRHRRGEFLPLEMSGESFAVLAVLESADLRPEEVASSMAIAPEADALHRQLRTLRRAAAKKYSVSSLVGDSPAMRQVRTQVAAAARSRANVLVTGAPGSGRSHLAQAIHFAAPQGAATPLVTLDCRLLTEDQLRRGLNALRRGEGQSLPTLLLLEIGHLPLPFQSMLVSLLQSRQRECQIVATLDGNTVGDVELDNELQALVATMAIDLPPLQARLNDLPLLAQSFLEQANVDSSRQVGSISRAALEKLTLYHWPGDVEELRGVIHAAHAQSKSHELQAADLPATMHHAAQAAQFAPLPGEMISLEEFMAGIQRELVLRALEQAEGNKALAARLLGITRPRLYRRLVQLGLLSDEEQADPDATVELSGEDS